MNRRMIGVAVSLALVAIAIVSSPIAFSQMEATPTVYTFVSQVQVPRANWAGYSEDTEKTVVPILEKLTADGTIASWSTFEQVVHTTDGYTHGAAWSSTTISGLMKVLDEVRKAGPRPGQIAATKHEDFLMQTSLYRAGSGAPAYLRVVCSNAKAEKPETYTATLKKRLGPTFEEQNKNGVARYYGIAEQELNTSGQSTACVRAACPKSGSRAKW